MIEKIFAYQKKGFINYNETIHDIKDFPFEEIRKLKKAANRRGVKKNKRNYVDAIASFDIETTKIPSSLTGGRDLSTMFVWQWHISWPVVNPTHEYDVFGRTWKEFCQFIESIAVMLGDRTLMMFVHNFSYEMSYLSSIIEFTNHEGDIDVFAVDERKPIKAMSHNGNIEWRDSYILTGMSLKESTRGLPHEKTMGDFDYTKKRFHFTPIDGGIGEITYIRNDVYGLCECIHRVISDHSTDECPETLYSLPLTATGFIRRQIQKLVNSISDLDFSGPKPRYISPYKPDSWEVYNNLLRPAFRGGNCHCNRYLNGIVLEDDDMVEGWDRSSSYPDVMVNDRFPIEPLQKDNNHYLRHLDELTKHDYAYLVDIEFHDIKCKKNEPLPYLSVSKLTNIEGLGTEDNGRLMSARSVRMVLTDVDYELVRNSYSWKSASIYSLHKSKYGYLDDVIRNYIIDLYKAKTELKGITNEEQPGAEERYRVSKADINGVYGLMVQRVSNEAITMDPVSGRLKKGNKKIGIKAQHEYEDIARKRALPYRYGVWCTAWARKWLDAGLRIMVKHGVWVYSDTDSNYGVGEFEAEFEELNKFFRERSKKSGAYATDRHGVVHYMGEYEPDRDKDGNIAKYAFCTLGAKKYCKEYGGHCLLTVSGVPKKLGSLEQEEAGGIHAFKPGMEYDAGKLRPVYNDGKDYGDFEVYDCYGNTGVTHVSSCCTLVDTSYKLSASDDYRELLDRVIDGDMEALDEILANSEDDERELQYYMDKYPNA